MLAQYTHHVLLSLKGLSQGELLAPARARESGLAWFLACSIADDPNYGRLDLNQRLRFPSNPGAMRIEDRADDAWASAFWGLRSIAPAQTVECALVAAYCSTLPKASAKRFIEAVLADARLGYHLDEMTELFRSRGFPVTPRFD